MSAHELIGVSATELATRVQKGELSPAEVLTAHLQRIAALDARLGAFQLVRADAAAREADQLVRRDDLGELPLAGVPVAIKDNIAVAGEPTRHGSLATPADPASEDHEIVRRLRAAGAIIVGKTRVPELCATAWTDSAFGVSRNPWDLTRTPGGSSGGSAAAVASAMVPVAHGSDGGCSIRIPAAACGLCGIKPGTGVVPGRGDRSGWFGLSAHGPLASTVSDLALMLSVMAARPELRELDAPQHSLRIAWSTKPPMGRSSIDPEFERAARDTATVLGGAGHTIEQADPPYERRVLFGMATRALSGIAEDAQGLSRRRLEPRSRPTVRIGSTVRRLGLVRASDRDHWRSRLEDYFARFDVLLTPTLAGVPILAEGWSRRSWLANARAAGFAPFTGVWNLAGYPAMAVPAGLHSSGLPLSVQLVAPEGNEGLLLSVARQLEQLQPWPAHAPLG